MDIPIGQSLPRDIMELIRIDLKDRKKAQKFFDTARKTAKQNIKEMEESKSLSSGDKKQFLFIAIMIQNETLRRIDDFEMAHLNMIDIREECCGKDKQDTPRNIS